MARYIPPQVFAALTSESVGTIHELYELDLPSGTRYWSRAKYTYRAQVYSPIVAGRGDIRTSLKSETDSVTVNLLNVDGTVRDLMEDDEFLDAECRIRLIVEGLSDSTTPAYSGTVGARTCTVNYVGPQLRDGEFVITWVNAASWFTISYTRHDGQYNALGTFGGTTGGTFTGSVAALDFSVTVTGTYGAGQNGDTWTFRSTNNFLLFAGIAENPIEAGEDEVDLTIHGMTELLMAPVPKRNFTRHCQWMFGPVAAALGKTTPCGYAGPTTTANGAGVASTALTVTSGTDFASAKGSSIKIGSGSAVVISAVSGTSITLAEARSWSNGDNVSFTDCRKYFGDCQDRNREHEFGGFRGIRSTKGIISKRIVRVHEDKHSTIGSWWNGSHFAAAGDLLGTYVAFKHGIATSRTDELIRAQRVGFPVADHDDPIPIVYGRRVVEGIPIEFFSFDDNAGRGWRSAFYAISGGTLPDQAEPGPIDAGWVAGKRKKHSVETIGGKEVLQHGFFTRRGLAASSDSETNAEYDTDSDAWKRAQNIDYQGGTGTAYGYIAYAIFRTKRNSDLWGGNDSDKEVPEAFFRVAYGKLIQAYNANGTVNGSPAFSQNPLWQILDLLTDVIDGAGIDPARFSYRRIKAAADYCDVLIDSVEADTLATAAATSTTIEVKTTAGFKFKETLYLNGVSTGFTIEDVPNGSQIIVSSAVTYVVGDRIHQKNARFQSDIAINRRDRASKVITGITTGCRGYLVQQDGELAFDVDRDLPSERATDGGFEAWSSATDLTSWTETLAGTSTVNREGTTLRTGTYAVRLAIDSSGNAAEISQSLGNLEQGEVFALSIWAKSPDGLAGETLSIRIGSAAGSGLYLQADHTWAAASYYHSFTFQQTTDWQEFFFVFRADPNAALSAHTVYIKNGPGFTSKNLYLDDFSVFGPVGGEWRDLGRQLTKQRLFILEGRDSFRQGPANALREINELKVSFGGSLGGTAYKAEDDGVIVRNEAHQATHVKKEQTIEAASLSTPDQAVRIAKYHLNRARTLKEGARFRCLFTGLLPIPGDVILLSHRAPNWSRRLHKVQQVSIESDYAVEITCEHYDETVYTDAGERSELGVSAGLPTITLSIDAAKTKRIDISWIPSTGSSPIDRYEVYADTATMSADDPPGDAFVGKTKFTEFKYQVPHDLRNTTIYLRVVGILHNGEFAVSNEVSTANSADTLDEVLDGNTRTLVHVPHNYVKNGDFSDNTKWTAAAHSATASVASDVGNLNATGHSGSNYPTLYRAFPGNGRNDMIPFKKEGWISVALSARYTGSAANGDIVVFLFSGSEVGDGTETNYLPILTIAAADIDSTWARFTALFQFGVGQPAAPGAGTAYKVGVRGFSTNAVKVDKLQILPGKVDLTSIGYRNHVDDEANNDEYGDFTNADAASGGGNYGGGLFTPGGGGGKYPDIL